MGERYCWNLSSKCLKLYILAINFLGAKTIQKRDSCRLASIDERVYAIGGYDNNADQYLSSIEVYDPSTDEWTLKSPMKVGRRSPGVVQYKGWEIKKKVTLDSLKDLMRFFSRFIYAVGGMGKGRDLDSIEQYNATTGESKVPHFFQILVSVQALEKYFRNTFRWSKAGMSK